MNAGFRALPNPRPMPGLRLGTNCGWCSANPSEVRPTKRWHVLVRCGRTRRRCCCISALDNPTACRCGCSSWAYWRWHERKANGSWLSSGTMPLGTKAPTCAVGYALTTGRQKQQANRACSPICCPSKAHGSIRLNRAGFMPSGVFVCRKAHSHHRNYEDGFALILRRCRFSILSTFERCFCTRTVAAP
jgi:hypothetical protein